jgi:DNA-binding MarR family transcriptional regulator
LGRPLDGAALISHGLLTCGPGCIDLDLGYIVVITTIANVRNYVMPYRLEDSLGFAIHRTDMRLMLLGAQFLRPHGLTTEQFAVLATLHGRDGMSQRELADHLVKDRPNITRILDKLQQKGLVQRRADPADRRVHRLHATAGGHELMQRLTPSVLEMRERMFGGLSPRQQATLRDLLDRLFNSLE